MISINQCVEYKWCRHALQRWNERFAGIRLDLEFGSAQRAGQKQKKLIRRLTPWLAEKYMTGFNGRYYLIGRSNIVFIVQSKAVHTIITVFHLYGLPED